VVPDDPLGHTLKLVEQRNCIGLFMSLPRCQPEGDGAVLSVGDHASNVAPCLALVLKLRVRRAGDGR
jgi:hypothetical protein